MSAWAVAMLAACGGGTGAAEAPMAMASAAAVEKNRAAAPKGSIGVKPNVADGSLRGAGKARMVGGPGNDVFMVTGVDDQVVEREGEGIDQVLTSVSFTLPAHVENMSAYLPTSFGLTLVGNALNNHIVGGSFSEDTILGMAGDDILDGGGRYGGFLDGGEGNDRLIVSFGVLKGGPGADTFVAGGRGAHTHPTAPVTIVDFNAAEGDRIEITHVDNSLRSEELFAKGMLHFDPATGILTLDTDPSTTHPSSVDQIIIVQGAQRIDPAWIKVGRNP